MSVNLRLICGKGPELRHDWNVIRDTKYLGMGRGDKASDTKDATLVPTIQPRWINTVTGLSFVWGRGCARLGTFLVALTCLSNRKDFRNIGFKFFFLFF